MPLPSVARQRAAVLHASDLRRLVVTCFARPDLGGVEVHVVTGEPMPRYPDPMKCDHQLRQRQYRMRLTAKGAPEAAIVDAALAAAAVCYIDAVNEGYTATAAEPTAELLMRGALKLLISDGYDRAESLAVMRRRLTRPGRRDLGDLTERSRIRSRMRRVTE